VKQGTKLYRPRGVQTNVPLGVLATGWRIHYRKPYCHHTAIEDIDPGQGHWMLVAARDKETNRLGVVAVGERRVVTLASQSNGLAYESNGVYWYFVHKHAFGFAPSENVVLCSADSWDYGGNDRLSWLLGGYGGYRAGTYRKESSRDDGKWEKIICWADGSEADAIGLDQRIREGIQVREATKNVKPRSYS
jgi:hypothetical protein